MCHSTRTHQRLSRRKQLRCGASCTSDAPFQGTSSVGTNGQPEDNLTITPGFPGISGTQLFTDASGWAVVPGTGQSDPFNPAYAAGNGQVLIGQFSTADGTGFSGTMLTRMVSNGVVVANVVSFVHVPAPGAVGLLGIAGFLGGRRRRLRGGGLSP